jgi:hypothetical protein
MQAAPCGGYSVIRVESRWASHNHDIHWTMPQESIEIRVGRPAVFSRDMADSIHVGSVNRNQIHTAHRSHSASVRIGDVAAADQADGNVHRLSIVLNFTGRTIL